MKKPTSTRGIIGAQRYEAGKKLIVCPHCGNDRFDASGFPVVGFIYDCSNCSARLLFAKALKRLDDVVA